MLENGYGAGIGFWFVRGRRGREGRVGGFFEACGIAFGLEVTKEIEDLGVRGAVAGTGGVEKLFGFIADSQCCDYERRACDVGIATELSADDVFYGGHISSVEAWWYVNETAFREKGSVESDG